MEEKNTQEKPLYSKGRLLLVLVIIALLGSFLQMQGYQPPVVKDGVAESRFLGLSYTLPEGWTWGDQESRKAVEKQAAATELSRTRNRHCVFTAQSGDSSLFLLVEKTGDDGLRRVSAMLTADGGELPAEDVQVAGVAFRSCTGPEGRPRMYFCVAKDYLVMISLDLEQGTDAQTVLEGFSPL